MEIRKNKDGLTGSILLGPEDFPPTKEKAKKMTKAFPPDEWYIKPRSSNSNLLEFRKIEIEEKMLDMATGRKPLESIESLEAKGKIK